MQDDVVLISDACSGLVGQTGHCHISERDIFVVDVVVVRINFGIPKKKGKK